MRDDALATDLAAMQHARIFFAHRSVGNNLLHGISRLYAIVPGAGDFTVLRDTSVLPTEYFADALIGENGRPETKCSGFVGSFERFNGDVPDVAMMKFCFVDFGGAMKATEIFSLYMATIDTLKHRYPSCTFVHMTAPLTARRSGVKELFRRLLGRGDRFEADNAERNTYNTLLREYYAAEPIFDLAAIESTHRDGSRETYHDAGARYFAMAPEYTDDGGHLNETGQIAAARALIGTLAEAVRHHAEAKKHAAGAAGF